MKLTFGKKTIVFLHWLLSLLVCAAFAFYVVAPGLTARAWNALNGALGATCVRIVGFVLMAVYIALSIALAFLIFRRPKGYEKGFITVESGESGRVRISVSAVEQMVRQSVRGIDGITEMKIDIDSKGDALLIAVNASLLSGCNVPAVTTNMQRAIRQFVELNCGVSVSSVSITINSVTAPQESTGHKRLFGRAKEGAKAVPAEARPETAPVKADPAPVEYEAVVTPAQAPSEAVGASVGFDPDKPYESEFAKDLERMKAREAGQAADSAVGGDWHEA